MFNKCVCLGADVRTVNMKDLTSGVLHTKFWVVDKKHIYIGSANMDWRSLTQVHEPVWSSDLAVMSRAVYWLLWIMWQVKELGAVVYDCSCLAQDLGKIFEAYWFLGESQTIPAPWPSQYTTDFNKDTPMQLSINNTDARVYLSVGTVRCCYNTFWCCCWYIIRVSLYVVQSSPASLCAEGRTTDLDSILSVINDAHKFVYIAVMNYLPTMEYSSHKQCVTLILLFDNNVFYFILWLFTAPPQPRL